MARLDEYSLTPVFSPLFKQVSNSHSLTIDDKLWQQLEAMEWPKSLTDHSIYLPSPRIPPK